MSQPATVVILSLERKRDVAQRELVPVQDNEALGGLVVRWKLVRTCQERD
jgi:hypothetical protein